MKMFKKIMKQLATADASIWGYSTLGLRAC